MTVQFRQEIEMTARIRKVAVLGAGVMGQGIAAHLANAGIPSVLFDMVPRDLGADATEAERTRLASQGIQAALKQKPAAFFHKNLAELVVPANYEDHGHLLGECDLVIEVVVELLSVKQKVFAWVAEHRRPGAIVASNTSGLSLAEMAQSMDEELRAHFLVMHFFNPVRYMRLLELVAGEHTLPEVVETVAAFGAQTLGKGIVYAKDTPNFIANRIGTYAIGSVFRHMEALGLSVEEVDAVFGPAMGRPKSAVFRTCDLVGLDTLVHALSTVYEGCPTDEERDTFQPPSWLSAMVEEGALGEKSGGGFYKKTKVDGARVILARDLATGEYGPKAKVRFDSIRGARKAENPAESVRKVMAAEDAGAQIAWAVTADTLLYAARRLGEVSDDVVNIDRAMRWGFAWDLGPFQVWDALGVRSSVERMEAEGREVPAWVKEMLAGGRESFYTREEGREFFINGAGPKAVPMEPGWFFLGDVDREKNVVEKNLSSTLLDLGDGVLCVEFHSKMNALDIDTVELYGQALDRLDQGDWEALVVANQGGPAFCAGANLFLVAMAAAREQWDELERLVRGLQQVCRRARYSERPVVTAPWGLTLGGGAEVAMQSSATQAAGELYMGLVEVGVGVIPAGGGCTEMLLRYLGDIPEGTAYDPNPFVQQAFRNIAMATVATSAEEARAMGYLRPSDRITLDQDCLISDAKQKALGMVAGGWAPPARKKVKLPGASGRGAIEMFLYQMHEGGFATNHDVVVGKALARVMTGGDIPSGTWVDEQHILDLECEAFLSLCGEADTQQRIQHMLQTGKPLRN